MEGILANAVDTRERTVTRNFVLFVVLGQLVEDILIRVCIWIRSRLL